MSTRVRTGKLDVVILSGVRLPHWPSIGVRSISLICSEMGLRVGNFGGESLTVRGIIPLPGTGAWVIIEDIQKRVHRIKARSVVRVVPESYYPYPFPGWLSEGMIPISTAEKLKKENKIHWDVSSSPGHSAGSAILGTGNRAIRFGIDLIESGIKEVHCIEINPHWGAKRFSGWEVEKRRFESLGGKIIEAKPIELSRKKPFIWQLRLEDNQGIRILDIARLISAGPYDHLSKMREYPLGSSLYELEQTSNQEYLENVEGWELEKNLGKSLGLKIVKSLVNDLGKHRKKIDKISKQVRLKLNKINHHQNFPYTPSYQGKWMQVSDMKKLKNFESIPKKNHFLKPTPVIECFEEITCNVCQQVCPVSAIKNKKLDEDACISCGICVIACPSQAICLVHEKENQSHSTIAFSSGLKKNWIPGEQSFLVNRRGELLSSTRVLQNVEVSLDPINNRELLDYLKVHPKQLTQVEVPSHLVWEARGLKRIKTQGAIDENYLSYEERLHNLPTSLGKVEIILNDEKRIVRERISALMALFEIGQNRPSDNFFCLDGGCGQCTILVDGIVKLACQTNIHKGINLKTKKNIPSSVNYLCPCLEIEEETLIRKIQEAKLQSPEAILSLLPVGSGKCHGQICMGAFRRILQSQGIDLYHWIDWRFPWSDWKISNSR